MSPGKGSAPISSIATRMRARSAGETRSRDFCAGPARTTRHFFFSSDFIKGDVVTAFERGFASADGAQLGRRRSFHRNSADGKVMLQCFNGKIGRFPPLFPGGFGYSPAHLRGKFNCVLSFAHASFSLSPRERMSRCGSSSGSMARLYFKSFRKTTPPFITNLTRSISVMSVSGSPETATMSANLPFSI
jgi:hypothetical protein